jgi:type I restriction enzyme S subunit
VKIPTVKLGEICEINPATDCDFDPEDACSFVPMEAVDDVDARISRMATRPFREVAKGYTPFAENDVIVAKITPCMENGKCAIGRRLHRGVAFGSTEFHVLRATKHVIPEWLFYFWRFPPTRKQAAVNMTGSAGQKRVPASFLKTANIPLPELSEQRRITGQLDHADHLVSTRRYALELIDTFLPAVFLKFFGDLTTNPYGWDMATIDDAIALSQYGTSQKNNQGKRGYPILGMGNISYSGTLLLDSLSHVDLDETEFKKLRLVPGDIIFNRTNSTELVGKTAHWDRNLNAVLASYLVKLRLKNSVLPEFFVALLNTAHFKKLFQDRCKKAVGQSNISPTLLKEFPIYVPPFPLQQKFAAVARRVERLRAQQREAHRQAEHLFQTLLHRAFAENA